MSGGVNPSIITSATWGTPWAYNSTYPPKTVNGDGWNTTWDNLGNIFTLSNDGSNWNSSGSGGQILFNSLTNTVGDSTTVGTQVNGMSAWNSAAPPGGTWKWQGIISVSGTLYAIVNNINNSSVNSLVYSQLIKSTDHGVTWGPTPPYSSPSFPAGGPIYFIQYGQDYTGNGPDNSASFVYGLAVSTGGASGPYLGRVPIGSIDNASTWQYWTGGDGMNSANWSSSFSAALLIPFTGMAPTSMQYLPRYNKYFSVTYSWNFVSPPSTSMFVVCEHPWGPCDQLGSGTSWSQAFYGQSIVPSSLVNGGRQLVVTTAGDFHSVTPTSNYTLWLIPVTLTP